MAEKSSRLHCNNVPSWRTFLIGIYASCQHGNSNTCLQKDRYPLNRHVFNDDEFAPSLTTERLAPVPTPVDATGNIAEPPRMLSMTLCQLNLFLWLRS